MNNIKDVKEEEYIELFSALKNNDSLVKLTLANGDVADAACSELNRALSQNQSLRSLSLENNRISPDSIADMFEAINNGSGILELHLSNQAQSNMGLVYLSAIRVRAIRGFEVFNKGRRSGLIAMIFAHFGPERANTIHDFDRLHLFAPF